VSDTDGISATSSPIGPLFPRGLLVVHDAKNSGAASSNFKYVRLDAVVDLPSPVEPG
jgi:myo-inositol-hexaphosphate 3-phosphohydrolase